MRRALRRVHQVFERGYLRHDAELDREIAETRLHAVEEIEAHHQRGKPVMLYFSNRLVPPHGPDNDQLEEVRKFRKWAEDRGLISQFDSVADFREKFSHHLALNLNDNAYLRALRPAPSVAGAAGASRRPALSTEEIELLIAGAEDDQVGIQVLKTMAGAGVATRSRNFADTRAA